MLFSYSNRCFSFVIALNLLYLCLSCYHPPTIVDPPYAFWRDEDRILFRSNDKHYESNIDINWEDLRLVINGVLEFNSTHNDNLLTINLKIVIENQNSENEIFIRPEGINIWFDNIPLKYKSQFREDFAARQEQVVTVGYVLDLEGIPHLKRTKPNIKVDISRFLGKDERFISTDTLYAFKELP